MKKQKNTPKGVVRDWVKDRVDDFIFWLINITLDDVLMFVNILCVVISILCCTLYFVVNMVGY